MKIIYKKKKLIDYFGMVILIEIIVNVLVVFFMFLLIVYAFTFDKIDVEQKVRQYIKNVKNKIRTKWKI